GVFLYCIPLHNGELLESHIENRLSLYYRKLIAFHEPSSCFLRRIRCFDERDNIVEVQERNSETFKDVHPLLRFTEIELRPSGDNISAVIDEVPDELNEGTYHRASLDDREVNDPEAALHGRELIKLV